MSEKGRPVPPHGSGPAQIFGQQPIAESPFDVCACGDYRHQHADGKGRCVLNWAHAYQGACLTFKFFRHEPEKPKDILEPKAPPHD